jgi:hypothetical protein
LQTFKYVCKGNHQPNKLNALERLKINQMKTQRTTKADFQFFFSGHGHYKVIYESPTTGKKWAKVTNDMPLIDATKNEDAPKRKDLEMLKFICKH